jgi:2-succinyl-6-hydroxy-2,4-cyclohexadiene-1-carboxylate synthase
MRSLVLVHGFTGAPSSFDELVALVRARAGELPVHCPALLGHGASAPGIASFEGEVARLAQEIRQAGFSGAHLCGYSLGARVALGLLAREPLLFASATLVGVHPGLANALERSERRASDERWCLLLEQQGLEAFVRAWQDQPTFTGQAGLAEPRARDALQRQHQVRMSRDAGELARSLRVLGLAEMPDYRAALCEAPIPVTLVVGARDAKFLALAEGLAERANSLRLEVIEGAGHNLVLEAPEALAGLLTREVGP